MLMFYLLSKCNVCRISRTFSLILTLFVMRYFRLFRNAEHNIGHFPAEDSDVHFHKELFVDWFECLMKRLNDTGT